MKKTLATVACALALIMALPVVGGNTKLGQVGVDVVTAATGDATPSTPTTPTTPTKPTTTTPPKTTTTTTKTTSTTTTAVQTTSQVKRLLAFGSVGEDVKFVQTKLNESGAKLKVDGIFGKLTLAAVKSFQAKNGLKVDGIVGPRTLAKLPQAKPVAAVKKVAVKLGKAEYAAHGTKCFTVAVVAMAGDKIVDVIIDDYQVMAKEGTTAVPNSNADFGSNFQVDKALASKLANAASYSKNMKEKGGATLTVNQNFDAIEAFAKGKTIAQLEAIAKTNNPDPKVDAVSSATLVDTTGYLKAIVEAAKNATTNRAIELDEKAAASVKVGKVEYASHGTKCYTLAAVAMAGDKVVGALVDDYQVMAKDGTVAVPNSDADFGKNVLGGKVLASKLANAASYSKNMKEKGGATLTVNQNFAAIETFVIGKTAAELEGIVKTNNPDPKVDAVSSATLVDTTGYLSAFVAAAKETSGKVVTHKGDLYIDKANYTLLDTKVEGNIYFTTQEAKDTFKMGYASSVTGSKILAEVDAVTTPSVVKDNAAFEKAISKDGTWIPCITQDLTFYKELVLEGEFKNTKTPPVTIRKIALYSQDDKRNVTRRFTLTAPKLTIKSPNANITKGIFVGDIHVTTTDFQLIDTKVVGNIYFTSEEAKAGFKMDATSVVTGKQEVLK